MGITMRTGHTCSPWVVTRLEITIVFVVGHVLTKLRGIIEYEVRKWGYSTFWEVEIDLCMS